MLEYGVTTAEVKSGYGLSLQDELKMLQVVQRLSALQPLELVPTLLCAHAVPEEYREWREAYVDLCVRGDHPRGGRAGAGALLRRLRRGGRLHARTRRAASWWPPRSWG